MAQETGLTKATVSALVTDLLGRDLVEELDTPAGRIGRPATDVGINGRTVGGLGLQVDADRVAACIVDLSGQVLFRRVVEHDFRRARPKDVLAQLVRSGRSVLSDAGRAVIRCAGATVAVPGLVDPTSGALFVAPNLHWLDLDLTELGQALGLPASMPVGVENEANLGALAEQQLGAGNKYRSFIYLSGGVGVGAGIVLEGQLMRGAHGFAGEVGHVVIEPDGKPCACGARGCLETVVGAGRRVSERRRVEALSVALRSVVNTLDPEAVVLGGSFAGLGPALASELAERLGRDTLGARWHPCEVQVSGLGVDAALIGAATSALHRVLADPTTIAPIENAQSA